MENPISTYDFTASKDYITRQDLHELIERYARKWCYQEEKSESGFEHYQGRLSLKCKARLTTVIHKFGHSIHWSPTSKANRDNDYYVMKEETRVDGPWADTDEVIVITRPVRDMTTLRPFQQTIIDMANVYDDRHIDIIIDLVGNLGKSALTRYMRQHKLARPIPISTDYRDISRSVMDFPISRCYIFDLPRAMPKYNLDNMFSAIETIKDGYAYDSRYKGKEREFDPPAVFVFTNEMPNKSLLSRDRWRFWKIAEDMTLQVL